MSNQVHFRAPTHKHLVRGDSVGVLACIVCHKQPERVDRYNPDKPYAATEFESRGSHGSTVWDPNIPNLRLEIVVCDTCMRRAAHRHLIAYTIYRFRRSVIAKRIRRFWNPHHDERRDRE